MNASVGLEHQFLTLDEYKGACNHVTKKYAFTVTTYKIKN